MVELFFLFVLWQFFIGTVALNKKYKERSINYSKNKDDN